MRSLMVLLLILGMIAACTRNNNMAGVVTESTNGSTVSGVVSGGNSLQQGATVTLIPEGYNPLSDSGLVEVTTDSTGNFRIHEIPQGRYHLVASNSDGQVAVSSLFEIDSIGSELNRDLNLENPASILIGLDSLNVEPGDIVFIPGTLTNEKIDSGNLESKVITIHDVPPSEYQAIIILDVNDSTQTNIIEDTLKVIPEDTTVVGNIRKWNFEKEMIVDLSSVSIENTVYNYPLLVRIGFEDIDLRLLQPKAQDLRFVLGRDTLKYEIESWDVFGGEGVIWLGLDSISPTADKIAVTVLWGNDTVSAGENSGDLFDSSLDFTTVYHFSNFEAELSGIRDMSNNQNHGNYLYNIDSGDLIQGIIGEGVSFSEDSAHLSGKNLFENPLEYSYSLWFKTTTDSGGLLVEFTNDPLDTLALGISPGKRYDRKLWMDNTGKLHYGVWQDSIVVGNRREITLSSDKSFNDGKWHFAYASLNRDGLLEFFIDGEKIGSQTGSVPARYNGHWRLGSGVISTLWEPVPHTGQFKGILDEFRVYDKPISVERIKLDFHSQKLDSELIQIK